MENNRGESKFNGFQKTALGIGLAFYTVYKFFLNDAQIIKNLGSAYPGFILMWTIIMVSAFGISGWALVNYLKTTNLFKKKDKE